MKLNALSSMAAVAALAALVDPRFGTAQGLTFDRIQNSSREPQNWLTYSGNTASWRYSELKEISKLNVSQLQLKWAYNSGATETMEATPIVLNGVMYLSQGDEVIALDARSGIKFWSFRRPMLAGALYYKKVTRGVAVLGDKVFWAQIDGRLTALDIRDGHVIWDITVADGTKAWSISMAPTIIKDKVVVGLSTGEFGRNCWISAFDVNTGKESWRFNIIPNPGDPGSETWDAKSLEHGGGSVWLSGSYDPTLNLVYFGTGNPNPAWYNVQRPGDNLYTDSVVALDADTGKLKWHYQFTPNDPFDFDAVQMPVLIDKPWKGKLRKLMITAQRNGFYYVLDRATGEFLHANAFVNQTWNKGFTPAGRPIFDPAVQFSSAQGITFAPAVQGGTNWYSPSYSPRTNYLYVSVTDNTQQTQRGAPNNWTPGRGFAGLSITANGAPPAPLPPGAAAPAASGAPGPAAGGRGGGGGRAPAGMSKESEGYSAVDAIDALTGQRKWRFKEVVKTESGVLSTATDLVFSGSGEGQFFALDAVTGKPLWNAKLPWANVNGPMSYAVDGRQYVAIASGSTLFIFGLPEK